MVLDLSCTAAPSRRRTEEAGNMSRSTRLLTKPKIDSALLGL
jgi:hypothetical protein